MANGLPATSTQAPSIKETDKIGWLSLVALGLGGANISLLLFGSLLLGQGTMGIALLTLGIFISWIALPGWIELVLMFPKKIGGIASCSAAVFGEYAPSLSCLIGVGYWIAWASGCAFGATFTAQALQVYFPNIPIAAIASFMIILYMSLNFLGIKWTARVFIILFFFSIILALLSAFIPIFFKNVNWPQAFNFHLITRFPGLFGQFTSVMAALYLIAFSAPAFENALCYVNETRAPQRNVPLAAYLTAAIAGLYFIILPIVWLGVLGIGPLSQDTLATSLPKVFSPLLSSSSAQLAAVTFMVTNMSVFTAAGLAGISRTLAQLSLDGFVPESFGRFNNKGAPVTALFASALVALLMVWFGTPKWLLAGTNLAYLTCICLASVAVWLMRIDDPNRDRLYRAPRGMIVAGLVAAFIWVIATIFGFQQFDLSAVIPGIAFSISSILFYVWRKLADRRKKGLVIFGKSIFRTLHVKLTLTMLTVLSVDAIGYLIAVKSVPLHDTALIVILEDIFILVALLTIAVGLVLPDMIAKGATEVSETAKRLAQGTLADFSRAMEALSRGDLNEAKAKIDIYSVKPRTYDEIGEIAETFNTLQEEVAKGANALDGAREGLSQARNELLDLNLHLEERIVDRTKQLRKTNEELQVALDNLKSAQEQLVESGKMAALGKLVAGVAHEINTPIGICITAMSQLKVDVQQMSLEIEENRIDKPKLEKFVSNSNEIIFLIENNLNRVVDLIVSFKQVSADTVSEQCRDIILSDYLRQIGLSLKPVTKKANLQIIIKCPEEIRLTTYPNAIFQVITIFVMNSIEHGFEKDQHGTITINAAVKENKVNIVYSDTGKGIAAQELGKIFEPFYTTKRFAGSTGLGLSIAYDIVTKILHGQIYCKSELGHGVNFYINFPRKLDS